MSSMAVHLYELFLVEFCEVRSIHSDNMTTEDKKFAEHIRQQLWHALPVGSLHCILLSA